MPKKRTHQEYVKELKEKNPCIQVVETFSGMQTKILHHCLEHDVYWYTYPENILKGCGCKQCGLDKLAKWKRKTSAEYSNELKRINPNIVALEEYKGANISIRHKCLIDGFEWNVSPASLLSGTGCPKCNQSHGQRYIGKWLDNHNVVYEKQKRFADCRDKHTLPFDFYLPAHNVMIEYDGQQHFSSIDHFGGEQAYETRVKHDQIKNEYCASHNIPLLRIRFDQDVDTELTNFLLI